MNELHVTSKLHNEKDVLEVFENLADGQDVAELRQAVQALKQNKVSFIEGFNINDNVPMDSLLELAESGINNVIVYFTNGAMLFLNNFDIDPESPTIFEQFWFYYFDGDSDGLTYYGSAREYEPSIWNDLLMDCYDSSFATQKWVNSTISGLELGTKLYKHEINFAFNKKLIVYINKSEAFVSVGEVESVFSGFGYFINSYYNAFAGGGSPLFLVTKVDISSNIVTLYGIRQDGTSGNESIDTTGWTFTDTVTPL